METSPVKSSLLDYLAAMALREFESDDELEDMELELDKAGQLLNSMPQERRAKASYLDHRGNHPEKSQRIGELNNGSIFFIDAQYADAYRNDSYARFDVVTEEDVCNALAAHGNSTQTILFAVHSDNSSQFPNF